MARQDIVTIKTHGCLAEHLGHKEWNLSVKTVGQALNGIEVLSKRKLFKFLLDSEQKGIKYKVLINGRDFLYEKLPTPDDLESIRNSELCAKINNLESIDIVPVLEGAAADSKSIGAIIIGVVLIIVGIIVLAYGGGPIGVALIIGGIGLVAAGVINLLSKGPELQEFTQRQKTSYLFSGPVNTLNEGGPVPVGYGRLLVGSSVISASYDIKTFDASEANKN